LVETFQISGQKPRWLSGNHMVLFLQP